MSSAQPGAHIMCVGEMAGWVEDGVKSDDNHHLIITYLVTVDGLETLIVLCTNHKALSQQHSISVSSSSFEQSFLCRAKSYSDR